MTTNAVVRLQCNSCCGSAKVGDVTAVQDYQTIRLTGCYGSSFPLDGDRIEFVLCGSCLRGLMNAFAIPHDTEDVGIL